MYVNLGCHMLLQVEALLALLLLPMAEGRAAGPHGAHSATSLELQQVALEGVLDFCTQPGFARDAYLNLDCRWVPGAAGGDLRLLARSGVRAASWARSSMPPNDCCAGMAATLQTGWPECMVIVLHTATCVSPATPGTHCALQTKFGKIQARENITLTQTYPTPMTESSAATCLSSCAPCCPRLPSPSAARWQLCTCRAWTASWPS